MESYKGKEEKEQKQQRVKKEQKHQREQKGQETKVSKKMGIKAKLILSILPCFLVTLLVIAGMAYVNSKNSITSKTGALIAAEGKAGVREIESWQNGTLSTLQTMVNSIQEQNFDDEQILKYLAGRLGKNDDFPNGMYIFL